MNVELRTCGSFAVAFLAMVTASAIATPPERTLTVDPTELIAGRTTPGRPELAVEHEGIEYRFATPESMAAFVRSPSTYEVFDGGACGAMGPLAGMGNAQRHVVHEGRIFFFASDACRETFLKDPAKRIEIDDEIPAGSPAQIAAGKATMDRLLAWAGGADRIRGINAFRSTASRQETTAGKVQLVTNEVACRFPDHFMTKDAWGENWYSTVRDAEGAAMASSKSHEVIARSRRRAFDRSMARWPVVILKAYVDGAATPVGSSLVVVGDGDGTAAGVPVEFVKVAMNGATSRLAVDKATGRLVELSFHGRDTTSSIGDAVRTFTKQSTVAGVTLPTAYRVSFNGKDLASAGGAFDAFEINPELPTDLFTVRK